MRVSDIQDVLNQYDLGQVNGCVPIESGLMHQTFKVDSDSGRFILQRLHEKLSTTEILNDYVRVTAHLQDKGFLAPRVIDTRKQIPIHRDHESGWWRLTTFIDGQTHERVTSVEQTIEGARMLGAFHLGMMDFPHAFESAHPLHDTDGHLRKLMDAVANPNYAAYVEQIKSEVSWITEMIEACRLPNDLPLRVVHGDPKISNVMFNGHQAIGMIDLDTCNRHTVLVDLGDAIRSWCRDGYEDEAQRFHIDRFEGILSGYAQSGSTLSPEEVDVLWMAGPMITLELASRFARDVLEDEYFAYNAKQYETRRAHNLARMKSMMYLAEDMLRHKEAMIERVRNYFP